MTNCEIMQRAYETLWHARTFITSKERMSPTGVDLYDELLYEIWDELVKSETPDKLLRQSEREGWSYAKECEDEVKRLTECLKSANADTETVERKWYLRGQQLENIVMWLESNQPDVFARGIWRGVSFDLMTAGTYRNSEPVSQFTTTQQYFNYRIIPERESTINEER